MASTGMIRFTLLEIAVIFWDSVTSGRDSPAFLTRLCRSVLMSQSGLSFACGVGAKRVGFGSSTIVQTRRDVIACDRRVKRSAHLRQREQSTKPVWQPDQLGLPFLVYCTKLSRSGCNLFRRTYSMRAPTRNATVSAMTSDQTTP
jgi:hypothetical protein